jgi:hypothetical protein
LLSPHFHGDCEAHSRRFQLINRSLESIIGVRGANPKQRRVNPKRLYCSLGPEFLTLQLLYKLQTLRIMIQVCAVFVVLEASLSPARLQFLIQPLFRTSGVVRAIHASSVLHLFRTSGVVRAIHASSVLHLYSVTLQTSAPLVLSNVTR